MKRQIVICTDLIGILTDASGGVCSEGLQTLHHLEKLGIPLVLASSKTRAEVEFYREKLGLFHPFITENGGGTFIPADYFSFPLLYSHINESYKTIEIGIPYKKLRAVLKSIEERLDCVLLGVGDMTNEQVVDILKLPYEQAARARVREFEEPFIMEDPSRLQEVLDCVRWTKANIRQVSGLCYLTGDHDKGQALKLLYKLYEQEYGDILLVAIGNKEEDIPMFKQAKIAVLLPGEGGVHIPVKLDKTVTKIDENGISGFRQAVMDVLSRFGP